MAYIPNDLYQEVLKVLPIATVDLVILNSDCSKTLLFKRLNKPAQGEFYTPGGRVEKNEKIIDTALRKAQEEIGLSLEPKDLVFVSTIDEIFPNSAIKGVSTHCVNSFYRYILPNDEHVKLDSQHSQSSWFSVSDSTLHPFVKLKVALSLKLK